MTRIGALGYGKTVLQKSNSVRADRQGGREARSPSSAYEKTFTLLAPLIHSPSRLHAVRGRKPEMAWRKGGPEFNFLPR